jgi:hypothetical protein
MTDHTYTLPTVHLNGTGRQSLSDEYMAAYTAARRAFDALCDATCNARDYYVQGDDAYFKARDERDRQLDNLRDLIRYTEAHVAHLLPE